MNEPLIRLALTHDSTGEMNCQFCGSVGSLAHVGYILRPGRPEGPSILACARCLYEIVQAARDWADCASRA